MHDIFVTPSRKWVSPTIHNYWSFILGNQGIEQIYEIITVLLTALVLLTKNHRKKNIDSKMTNVATCKVNKKIFLDVNYVILIEYNYQTAKARALYESTDGRAGQPADNPPNPDSMGDVHWTVPELIVWVSWRPKWRLLWQLGSDLGTYPKRRSGTVANTSCASRCVGWQWDDIILPSCDDQQNLI